MELFIFALGKKPLKWNIEKLTITGFWNFVLYVFNFIRIGTVEEMGRICFNIPKQQSKKEFKTSWSCASTCNLELVDEIFWNVLKHFVWRESMNFKKFFSKLIFSLFWSTFQVCFTQHLRMGNISFGKGICYAELWNVLTLSNLTWAIKEGVFDKKSNSANGF